MTSKRALLVGISQYPDPVNNLMSCVADTERFRSLLTDLYGFQDRDIVMLHDSAATLDNVRRELQHLFTGVASGDQIVFYESSHGYRYAEGSVYTEVLCLYDQFLADDELVRLSQQVPPGTFTCVIDACHSAGLEKLFFAPDGLHSTRAKVWQPPPERLVADLAALKGATSFKSFGRAATSDTGAVAKRFSPAAFESGPVPRAKSGEGQPELNGVLLAACLANETAADGSPPTDDLSAFTWALGQEVEGGGTSVPTNELRNRILQRLRALNLGQTPDAQAPMRHGNWLTSPLITYGAPVDGSGTPAPVEGSTLDELLAELGLESATPR